MEAVTITQITPPELEKLILDSVRKVLKENPAPATSDIKDDRLLTIGEAAELLSLSIPTLYGKIHKREIPFCKRSKRVYFNRKELINYIQEGRKQTVQEIEAEADNHLSNLKRK